MNLTKSILHLFPNAIPRIDFEIQDDSDGNGPYIALWNLSQPQPTQAELSAAWELVKNKPAPPTEMEMLRHENEQLNLSIIELWESIIPILP